jgi:hypothetical protein
LHECVSVKVTVQITSSAPQAKYRTNLIVNSATSVLQ